MAESFIGKFFVATDCGAGDSHRTIFYKVVGETKCSVRVVRVENEVVSREGLLGTYAEIDRVVPSNRVRTDFYGNEEKPVSKRVKTSSRFGKYISFEFWGAYLWDGEPCEHFNLH